MKVMPLYVTSGLGSASEGRSSKIFGAKMHLCQEVQKIKKFQARANLCKRPGCLVIVNAN